jgi:hypothetical protein
MLHLTEADFRFVVETEAIVVVITTTLLILFATKKIWPALIAYTIRPATLCSFLEQRRSAAQVLDYSPGNLIQLPRPNPILQFALQRPFGWLRRGDLAHIANLIADLDQFAGC